MPSEAGKPALRAYLTAALAGIAELEFRVLHTLYDPATRTLAIRFVRAVDGQLGHSVERLRFGPDGRVVTGEGYYGPSLIRDGAAD